MPGTIRRVFCPKQRPMILASLDLADYLRRFNLENHGLAHRDLFDRLAHLTRSNDYDCLVPFDHNWVAKNSNLKVLDFHRL
jgi:hypothetical protein